MNYNKLTPEEIERLAMLSEECGEVVQIVGKILRHGYESRNPFAPAKLGEKSPTNRELLIGELRDIAAIVRMMENQNDIDVFPEYLDPDAIIRDTIKRKLHFTHYQMI